MYRERMNSYYPEVIQRIYEFKGIIDSEYPEFEDLELAREQVLSDAYLLTMSEDRIIQWETLLNIKPILGSTLDDRRDVIIARIRGQGKLNTELINTIVKTFTGGTAISYVSDGVLYIEVTPPADNKAFLFENVEQELKNKVPAHLGLTVKRNYFSWEQAVSNDSTWQNVLDNFDTWRDVFIYIPFETRRV